MESDVTRIVRENRIEIVKRYAAELTGNTLLPELKDLSPAVYIEENE